MPPCLSEVLPTTPWNYALQIDRRRPSESIAFSERPVGRRPFTEAGAPILATVKGRRLPSWGLEKNAAAPPPVSPVESDQPLEDLTLIPYGCTSLRVTIQGVVFDHMIYHFVLTYSNWETGKICFAESFESLSEGLQNALWQAGGAPQ